jgi:hypothetical protein
MAQVIGERNTNTLITSEDRLVRYVEDEIGLLEPDTAPLITFLNKMKGGRMAVPSTKVEWIEDDYVARWAQNGGTTTIAADSASTTITVTDGTLFVPGDTFIVPNAVDSAVNPEVIRVVAVASNLLTVVRGVGGSTLTAINPSAALRILGSAYEEGALPPSAKTTIKSTKFSYTQIFRTACNITKTHAAVNAYGVNSGERKFEHKKKLKEHKIAMNAAAIWGRASQDLTGGPNGKPIRTTAGLDSVIATNIVDAGGTLTTKTFESFARQAFRYGSSKKILLASPLVVSAFHQWANSHMRLEAMDKAQTYGVSVSKVITGHGELLLVRDWMLENGIAGKNGMAGVAYAVDPSEIKYFYLKGNGESRDTRIEMDVIKDGRDAYVDEILTEGGFCFKQEKYHAKLYNVTDFSA